MSELQSKSIELENTSLTQCPLTGSQSDSIGFQPNSTANQCPLSISHRLSHEADGHIADEITLSSYEISQLPKINYQTEKLNYDMSGEKILIIFNHYKYLPTAYYKQKLPIERVGTDKDVQSLQHTFLKLGFDVRVYDDLKYQRIIDVIAETSERDHSATSCLAVAILTHGDRGGKLYAADKTYYLEDITTLLQNGHDTLVTKPKLFFIQACRGNSLDDGRLVNFDASPDDDDFFITVPTHSDFLFLYSTVEDYLSWRNTGGSWLIQELCRTLNTFSEYFDLLRMMTIVTKHVAYGRETRNTSSQNTNKKKQTPELKSTLTKFIQFECS